MRPARFAAVLVLAAALPVYAQTLRIGLAEDPDVLDPSMARTFVGRIVFTALCDKLVDIDENLKVVPMLATSWEWGADGKTLTMKLRPNVLFHDGEKLDAAAVKYSIERHKTIAGSNRKGELAPVTSVDVIDPLTVRFNLSGPFAPLIAVLTDRAGMIVSPKAAQALGEKFNTEAGVRRALPVRRTRGAGPHRGRALPAVLEQGRDPLRQGGLPADRGCHGALANLKSGQLDFIERMAPSDVPGLKDDKRFRIAKAVELGYQGITINVSGNEFSKRSPLGTDPRVREALELSLDREAIVQVAQDGEGIVGNQWVNPKNPWYAKSLPPPKRNVERAKALLREAGAPNPSFTLMTGTTSDAQRVAQIVQAMAKEAGFDVKLQATEFATALKLADQFQFEAFVLAWSGRLDPDSNLYQFTHCKQPQNNAGYCKPEVDALEDQQRVTIDPAQRARLLEQVAGHILRIARSSTSSTATGSRRTRPSSRA
jgi:peptide/nickel transport system substrate-binding protein